MLAHLDAVTRACAAPPPRMDAGRVLKANKFRGGNQRASRRDPGSFLTREWRPPSRPKQRAQTRNGLNTGHRNPSANMTANLFCRPLVAVVTECVDTDR
mgnify:CR=1 FL=1